jgi:hypothetical protein
MTFTLDKEYFEGMEKYDKLYLVKKSLVLYKLCVEELGRGNRICIVSEDNKLIRDVINII